VGRMNEGKWCACMYIKDMFSKSLDGSVNGFRRFNAVIDSHGENKS
jgi:hypothetical protein